MSTTIIVILIVVVVALLAVSAALYLRRKRSEQLREEFGSEYERKVSEAPNRSAAEKELQGRKKRHDTLDIRPLEDTERASYRESWEKIQRGFVDSPGDAVRAADRLVIAIMSTRGYPTDDFDQRADDVSVEHPEVVQHYRSAHQVAVAHERGDAGTEDLRHAAISYRSLVQALLDDDQSQQHDPAQQQDRTAAERSAPVDSPNGHQSQPRHAAATTAPTSTTPTSTNRSDA